MMLKKMLKHELIGLEAKVIDADNKSLVGIEGTIANETKNLLIIEKNGKFKKIIKSQITLLLKIKGKQVKIDGKMLVGRPEDRIKKW